METVRLGRSGRETTRLGFGCSSVMGALGRKESLALLGAAYDAGIRHFDVAPMYGYGQAEGCLGEFLAGHRGEATVTTKYGIPAAKNQSLMGAARRVAGPVVKLLPGLKQRLAKAASGLAGNEEKASFTAAQARESLERSLRALRTERIDVWLLHEVEAAELRDEGLLRMLEDAVAAGTIGTFGVGSDGAKVPALIEERPAYCEVIQYEWSVLDPVIEGVRSFRIHHRALTDNFRELHRALRADAAVGARWSEAAGADLRKAEVLAGLMLKAALVLNPESVILFSSKTPEHIVENVRVAGEATLAAPARALHRLVQSEGHGLLARARSVDAAKVGTR